MTSATQRQAQLLIEQRDAAAPGAAAAPLPTATDAQVLQMDARVPDPDANATAVHVAQLQRRARRRLTARLAADIRADGTLTNIDDPIWHRPPLGAPPSSGNPAAMFGAQPYVTTVDPAAPTHACALSAHAHRWRCMHMAHCER